jgi:hypothetical protein
LKFFDEKKQPKHKEEGPLTFSSSKWHWQNHVKTHQLVCVNIQIPQLLKGRTDQWGVDHNKSFL